MLGDASVGVDGTDSPGYVDRPVEGDRPIHRVTCQWKGDEDVNPATEFPYTGDKTP